MARSRSSASQNDFVPWPNNAAGSFFPTKDRIDAVHAERLIALATASGGHKMGAMDRVRDTFSETKEGERCPWPAWEPPVKVRLTVLPEHRCSYLPDRVAQSRAFWAEQMSGEVYHALMNAGFRRSGKLIYQPVCRGCRQCLPLRVPVAAFVASKSQRRCLRRNSDLVTSLGLPAASDEKWELYQRYQRQWHEGECDDRAGFESFLYESPVTTVEFTYRDASGRLLAVGLCDLCDASLSSVYFYFEPASAERGLGTYGALQELQFAAEQGIPYYYLGFWIDRCGTMEYKSTYRPHEVLHPDNVWRAGQG